MNFPDPSQQPEASSFPAGNAFRPSAPAVQPDAPRSAPMRFHGDAGTYFGIWIVNLLLTIVTLGIYSAWAKVRKHRWFYGNTEVDGHVFEYHATGMQIFKGRLMALGVIIATAVAGVIHPFIQLVVLLGLLVAVPWLMNSAMRFRARVTSWRNVRFDFQGSYGNAALVFLVMPFVGMLTLGLLMPMATRMAVRYTVNGHSWGGARFNVNPSLGQFYRAAGIALLPALAIGAVLLLLGTVVQMSIWHFLIMGVYLGFLVGTAYYAGHVLKLCVNDLSIEGGHTLRTDLSPWRHLWIVVSGLFATAFSLGLLYPWALVRRHRYVTQSITLHAAPGLDAFVSSHQDRPGSFASEYGEMEGLSGLAPL